MIYHHQYFYTNELSLSDIRIITYYQSQQYVCMYSMYICICIYVRTVATCVSLFYRLKQLLGYSKTDLVDRLPFDLHHHNDVEPCRGAHLSCKPFCYIYTY